jgi:hypothetical protein
MPTCDKQPHKSARTASTRPSQAARKIEAITNSPPWYRVTSSSMVLDAIEQAVWTRQKQGVLDLKDVVHQTDRASQYTCRSGSPNGSPRPRSSRRSAVSTVKTTSGTTAVQIVWFRRKGSRSIEQIGSEHNEVELAALKTAVAVRFATGQNRTGPRDQRRRRVRHVAGHLLADESSVGCPCVPPYGWWDMRDGAI